MKTYKKKVTWLFWCIYHFSTEDPAVKLFFPFHDTYGIPVALIALDEKCNQNSFKFLRGGKILDSYYLCLHLL